MSYQYRRLIIEAPKTYEELTRNRPTKKRNYNYTAKQNDIFQQVALPASYQKNTCKDFSFQIETYSSKRSESKVNKVTEQTYPTFKSKQTLQLKHESPKDNLIIYRKPNDIKEITQKVDQLARKSQKQSQQIISLTQKKKGYQDSVYKQYLNSQTAEKLTIQKYSYTSISDININKIPLVQKRYQFQDHMIQQTTKKMTKNDENQNPVPSNIQNPLAKTSKQNNQGIDPASIKHPRKVHYFYGQKLVDKEKVKLQVQRKYDIIVKKELFLSKNSQLDFKIAEVRNRILDNSPLMLPVGITQNIFPQEGEQDGYTQNLQVTKMANQLSKLIEVDMKLLQQRQAFASCNQEEKWLKVKTQLESKNIVIQENQLKQIIQVTIHQKNPFSVSKVVFQQHCIKQLTEFYAQAEIIWLQQLEKCSSLEKLNQQSSVTWIDLNSKEALDLEDLVCFVNVGSQKFYRSRDLVPLFRRFLKLQGKDPKRVIGQCRISKQTFVQKLIK